MSDSVDRLYAAVLAARNADPASSRTARLLRAGRAKMAKKLAEEAVEVIIDAMHGNREAVVRESDDLLYNLVVLWVSPGVQPKDVWPRQDGQETRRGGGRGHHRCDARQSRGGRARKRRPALQPRRIVGLPRRAAQGRLAAPRWPRNSPRRRSRSSSMRCTAIARRSCAKATTCSTTSSYCGSPPACSPRTSGRAKMAKKLAEEAVEVIIDAMHGNREAVVRESADLLYNLVVLWVSSGVQPQDVWREMEQRERLFGIAEKLHKDAAENDTRRKVVTLESRRAHKRR